VKRSDGKNRTPSGTQGSAAGGGTEAGATGDAPERSNVLRWVVIGGLVLIVFAAAGTIGSFVRDYKAKRLAPPTSATGPSALAVPVYGHSPVTLTVYEDMRDPASLQFSQAYDATLAQLVASGTANVYYREVAGVDAAQGGSGSLNAGNALGCAQDTSNKDFTAYRSVLLANQPPESTDSFGSKSKLIDLAKQVKGLTSDVFRACVDNGDHNVWVKDSTSAFKALGAGGVPVLQMELIGQSAPHTVLSSTQSLTPAQLTSMVMAAAATAPTDVPTPTPSSS
jgi:hypothetical protein